MMPQRNSNVRLTFWLANCVAVLALASGAFAADNNDDNNVDYNMGVLFCSEELIQNLPKQLTELNEVSKKLSEQFTDSKSDTKDMQLNMARLEQQLTELNEVSKELSEQFTDSKSDTKDMQLSMARLEQQVAKQSADIAKILNALELMNQQNTELTRKLDELKETRANDDETTVSRPVESQQPHPFPLNIDLPRSCADAMADPNAKDGVYQLFLPGSGLPPFYVHCSRFTSIRSEKTAWTTIQCRLNGTVNFYRDWQSYKDGFGYLGGDYFIGLEKLHALTTAEPHELLIFMMTTSFDREEARYTQFAIASEQEGYELRVLEGYSGDAGDSLRAHKNMKFTTYDRDNDEREDDNCAKLFKGGWWYRDCVTSNLNGLYLPGKLPKEQHGQAMIWHTWRGMEEGLKHVVMLIRPVRKTAT